MKLKRALVGILTVAFLAAGFIYVLADTTPNGFVVFILLSASAISEITYMHLRDKQ